MQKTTLANTPNYDEFVDTYVRTIVDALNKLNDSEKIHFLKEWILIEHIDALDEHTRIDQHIAQIKKMVTYTKQDMCEVVRIMI